MDVLDFDGEENVFAYKRLLASGDLDQYVGLQVAFMDGILVRTGKNEESFTDLLQEHGDHITIFDVPDALKKKSVLH